MRIVKRVTPKTDANNVAEFGCTGCSSVIEFRRGEVTTYCENEGPPMWGCPVCHRRERCADENLVRNGLVKP